MHEMSNLDIFYLCKELQLLVGSRIDRVYQLNESEFRIRFRIPSKGNEDLTFVLKEKMHLTNILKEVPSEPTGFVMFMRKHIENGRVVSIEQHFFDRIVVIALEKTQKYFIIIEMFSNGNIILTDSDYKILGCYRREEWKDRVIQVKQAYKFPTSAKLDPREIDKEKLISLLNEKYFISFLTSTINLGSLYLEELCLRSNLDMRKKASDMSEQDLIVFSIKLGQLFQELKPVVYYESGVAADYSLIKLEKYKDLESKEYNTLSSALDEFALQEKVEKPMENEKLLKIERKLTEQTKHLSDLESKAVEYRKTGDLLYANYDYVETILQSIMKLKKEKKSWDEIESAMKDKVLSIDKKTGKMTIELE